MSRCVSGEGNSTDQNHFIQSVQPIISKDHISVKITCAVAFRYKYFKEIYSCLYMCLLLGGLIRLQFVTQSAYILLIILTKNTDYSFKQN